MKSLVVQVGTRPRGQIFIALCAKNNNHRDRIRRTLNQMGERDEVSPDTIMLATHDPEGAGELIIAVPASSDPEAIVQAICTEIAMALSVRIARGTDMTLIEYASCAVLVASARASDVDPRNN